VLQNRKITFVGPGQVELRAEPIDDSNIPNGHVLLKNHYSLISTGTELACLAGQESSWFVMPGVPGYTCVGEIVKKAPDVAGFETGDIIYNYGGHQEYSVMPTSGCFMKPPAEIEEKYVPFIRMATIAAAAIRVSEITFGDWVAVTGLGMIGVMAAQLAHLQGARSIGIDRHTSRLAIAEKCNVDYTINPAGTDVAEKIKELTKGQMINTMVEAIGNTEVIVNSLDWMARQGEILLLGTPRTEYMHNSAEVFFKIFHSDNDLRIKGAHEWRDPCEADKYLKHSILRNTEIVCDYMVNGRLAYKDMLSHLCRPGDCGEVYHNLKANKDDYYGVVFDWTGGE